MRVVSHCSVTHLLLPHRHYLPSAKAIRPEVFQSLLMCIYTKSPEPDLGSYSSHLSLETISLKVRLKPSEAGHLNSEYFWKNWTLVPNHAAQVSVNQHLIFREWFLPLKSKKPNKNQNQTRNDKTNQTNNQKKQLKSIIYFPESKVTSQEDQAVFFLPTNLQHIK